MSLAIHEQLYALREMKATGWPFEDEFPDSNSPERIVQLKKKPRVDIATVSVAEVSAAFNLLLTYGVIVSKVQDLTIGAQIATGPFYLEHKGDFASYNSQLMRQATLGTGQSRVEKKASLKPKENEFVYFPSVGAGRKETVMDKKLTEHVIREYIANADATWIKRYMAEPWSPTPQKVTKKDVAAK